MLRVTPTLTGKKTKGAEAMTILAVKRPSHELDQLARFQHQAAASRRERKLAVLKEKEKPAKSKNKRKVKPLKRVHDFGCDASRTRK